MYQCDNTLCMGLAYNPYVFSKLSDFIVHCAVREGVGEVINYLDVFSVVSRDYQAGCTAEVTLISIHWRLGSTSASTKSHQGQVYGD